jgi:hypothetical protein
VRRRKPFGALAAGLAAVGVFVLWPRTERITRENYELIREGMGRAEVETILGPPGDHGSGPEVSDPFESLYVSSADFTNVHFGPSRIMFSPGCCDFAIWEGETFGVQVCYDQWDRVILSDFRSIKRRTLSPLDYLVWRGERQWRKWLP